MSVNKAITPEELFRAVVAHHPDLPKSEPERGFGSGALKVNGKIFASLSNGRLLLKLPEPVVDRLVSLNQGERFSTGRRQGKERMGHCCSLRPGNLDRVIATGEGFRAKGSDLRSLRSVCEFGLGATMTTFDKEVLWDGASIVFWAIKGKERIRCAAPRKTIHELAGFTNASSETIGDRRVEIKDLLASRALEKILRGAFAPTPRIKTVSISISDLRGTRTSD
jgi:hypothetical protein